MNIVITGASRGLGASIAEKFAADNESHHFFLCARNEQKLGSFARDMQARFPNATFHFFAADLAKEEQAKAFGNWVLGFKIPIHILINNAGLFEPGNIYNEPDGTLDLMLQVNLMSAYYITRSLLPVMMERKEGHIFNMCSIASLGAYPNGGAYSISKFALLGFSKNLREEMKPHYIKVTAVIPGAVYTDSWIGSGVEPGRIMQANDIAAMVHAAAQLSPQATVEDIVFRPQLGDL